MGVINAVRTTNKIEIPSIPNLKLKKSFTHIFSSTNWNSDIDLSNEYQRNKVNRKFADDEKIATYLEFFSILVWEPLVININSAPIKGINIIAERIGKFI